MGLGSCGKDQKSTSDKVDIKTIRSTESIVISTQQNSNKDYEKFIDTKFEYVDSIGRSLIIENSLPRGGLNYTDKYEKDYIYFIFWSKITNETNNCFEFKLEFSKDNYELPSSSDNKFKIMFAREKMEIDKLQLFDYGLSNLKMTLDNELQNSYKLQGTINSNETNSFYVIILFEKSLEEIVRTGLRLKDNNLYYRVNDKEIYSGKYNIKNLKLKH